MEIAGRGVCDTPLRGKVEPLWGSLNWVGGGTTGWHRWLVIFDYVAVGDSSSAKWVMNYFLERIAGLWCGLFDVQPSVYCVKPLPPGWFCFKIICVICVICGQICCQKMDGHSSSDRIIFVMDVVIVIYYAGLTGLKRLWLGVPRAAFAAIIPPWVKVCRPFRPKRR